MTHVHALRKQINHLDELWNTLTSLWSLVRQISFDRFQVLEHQCSKRSQYPSTIRRSSVYNALSNIKCKIHENLHPVNSRKIMVLIYSVKSPLKKSVLKPSKFSVLLFLFAHLCCHALPMLRIVIKPLNTLYEAHDR